MKELAASVAIVMTTAAVMVLAEPIAGQGGGGRAVMPHGTNRRPAARLIKRPFNEFLEPPPLPARPVVRNRRGNWGEGSPQHSQSLSLGDRIARWFYSDSDDGTAVGNQLSKSEDPIDMAPPPPPPGHLAPTAEAEALTQPKPPPPPLPTLRERPPPHAFPQPLVAQSHPPAHPPIADSQASGTHNIPGQQPPPIQNPYPAQNSYSGGRQKDCNPCNNAPWIPMAGHGGNLWGHASDAVPLAQAPIPFPELHKNPLPPVFPAENFNHIPPASERKPLSVQDHLVPPTADHKNVVFTIQEEKAPIPYDDLNAPRSNDHIPLDQQHQNTQNVLVSPPQPFGHYNQPSYNGKINYDSGKNVELVQSVPIASYVASVEYPMQYVQSPIIDISVKHNGPASHSYPAPTGESSQFAREPQAGLLPLQGEATAPGAPKHSVDSAASATMSGRYNIPPCQLEKYHNHNAHNALLHDTATATSQNTHTYVQELTGNAQVFDSQKLLKSESHPVVNLTLPSNHQPNVNGYRLLDSHPTDEPISALHSFGPPSGSDSVFHPTPSPLTSDASIWTSPSSVAPSTVAWTPEIVTEDSSSAASVTSDSQVSVKPAGTKKAKQIQIIVPYSVNKDTGKVQFHRDLDREVEDGRWLTSFPEPGTQARKVPPTPTGKDEQFDFHKLKDFHQAQESSIVTAELSPTPWTAVEDPSKDASAAFAGLQHILTTDLRSLLKGEEDSVDRLRLQKNIDNWTAQEFSSVKATRDTQDQEGNFGKTSSTSTTVSAGTSLNNKLNPSKHIPKEYLTTTPISATPSSVSTTVSHQSKTSPSASSRTIKSSARTEKKTTNGWTLFENFIIPGPTRTTPSSVTDRQDPEIVTAPSSEEVTPAPWERLQVSISPITREKVYVVTPQNKVDETRTTTPATTTTTASSQGFPASSRSVNDFIPFRQWKDSPGAGSTSSPSNRPRFSIRPTPGWPKGRGHKSSSNPENLKTSTSTEPTAKPSSLGPPSPSRATPRGFAVQTFSGHSKVFTATTSAWTKKKATSGDDKKPTTAKPTSEMTASSRMDTEEATPTESSIPTANADDDAEVSASDIRENVSQLVAAESRSAVHQEGPEIVIVETKKGETTTTTESSRTRRTTREIGRVNRGSARYVRSDDDEDDVPIKRYQTPPPRPKPTLHPRRESKRPPRLVMPSSTETHPS